MRVCLLCRHRKQLLYRCTQVVVSSRAAAPFGSTSVAPAKQLLAGVFLVRGDARFGKALSFVLSTESCVPSSLLATMQSLAARAPKEAPTGPHLWWLIYLCVGSLVHASLLDDDLTVLAYKLVPAAARGNAERGVCVPLCVCALLCLLPSYAVEFISAADWLKSVRRLSSLLFCAFSQQAIMQHRVPTFRFF